MKPCKPLLLLFACIASTHICNAQSISLDSVKYKYDQKTIHSFNGHYVKGYQTFYKFKDLQAELATSAEAKPYVVLTKNNITTARVFGFISFASLITAMSTANTNKNTSLGFLAGSLLCNVFTFRFNIEARNQQQHAIWLYNKDALLK